MCDVFDIARKADIALLGIGSFHAAGSSFYDLNPIPEANRKMLVKSGVVAEMLAHLIGDDGAVADYALNRCLVALEPDDLAECGRVIGIAAGIEKSRPIRAALNGAYLDTLVLDEQMARSVLSSKERTHHVV